MTYEQFIEESVRRQTAVIRAERMRMRRADALFLEYAKAMGDLGLHALTNLEIGDRIRELEIMERNVHETHGVSDTMRAIYEGRFSDAPKQKRRAKAA